ncbi:hypothetical protein HDU97_002951 [Phlyctochytrium planicorne]|nr:hypothetical protein HDU97_002951 [Phlyctochytrium planicorne]
MSSPESPSTGGLGKHQALSLLARTYIVRTIAIIVVGVMTLFSVSIFPATSNGTYWEMTDHMVDQMDTKFILYLFMPPAILILSSIIFLDAQLPSQDPASPTTLHFWRARWSISMRNRVFGTMSLGDLLMSIALFLLNIAWWIVPAVSRLLNPPGHHHDDGDEEYVITVRMVFDKLAGWAGWAGIWNAGASILFILRDNHLLKHLSPTLGTYHHQIRFHIYLGYLTLFHESFHSIYYLFAFYADNTFADNMFPWVSAAGYWNFAGLISWIALVVVALTSIYKVRRKAFGVFVWSHQLYVVFMFFALVHYYGWWTFTGPLIYFIYDRLAPRLKPHKTTSRLHLLTPTLLRLTLPLSTPTTPGSWLHIRIPTLSPLHHPFSIASTKRRVLYIKTRSGWTKKLHALMDAETPSIDIQTFVDGPFDGTKPLHHLSFDHLVAVASGAGMAAIIPFLETYAERRGEGLSNGKDVLDVVWVSRKREDVIHFREFWEWCQGVEGMEGVNVTVYLTREGQDVSTLLAGEKKLQRFDQVEEKLKVVEDETIETTIASTNDTPLAKPNPTHEFILNLLLVLATFGSGIGGFAFGRIQSFSFDMEFCMAADTPNMTPLQHFICWYYYYVAPVIFPVLFSLIGGLSILLLSKFIIPSPPATFPSTPTKPASIPSWVNIIAQRPNLKALLDEKKGNGVIVAGGERVVVEVEKWGIANGVWVGREAWKI